MLKETLNKNPEYWTIGMCVDSYHITETEDKANFADQGDIIHIQNSEKKNDLRNE